MKWWVDGIGLLEQEFKLRHWVAITFPHSHLFFSMHNNYLIILFTFLLFFAVYISVAATLYGSCFILFVALK